MNNKSNKFAPDVREPAGPVPPAEAAANDARSLEQNTEIAGVAQINLPP